MCKRPHCTGCSNRERILLNMNEKPKRKRVCHTCAISMDNILADSFRNSAELSFEQGEDFQPEEILKNGKTPVLAKTFTAGVRDTVMGALGETTSSMLQTSGSNTSPPLVKKGETMDIGFNEKGGGTAAASGLLVGEQSLFYEPHISKPIRGTRQVTIRMNDKGKLEGIPTAWREVLEMAP